MQLTFEVLEEGGTVPARYTCDGEDRSPPLAWGNPPPETRSFALIMDDPDAPGGLFRHWAIFDIPAEARRLAEGVAPDACVGAHQARNDFGRVGYGGPCPPRGHGAHRYRFRLLALDIPRLAVEKDPNVSAVEQATEGHVLASAVLTAQYGRE